MGISCLDFHVLIWWIFCPSAGCTALHAHRRCPTPPKTNRTSDARDVCRWLDYRKGIRIGQELWPMGKLLALRVHLHAWSSLCAHTSLVCMHTNTHTHTYTHSLQGSVMQAHACTRISLTLVPNQQSAMQITLSTMQGFSGWPLEVWSAPCMSWAINTMDLFDEAGWTHGPWGADQS